MAFEVASVKANISSDQPHANFPLDAGDNFPANGGLFSVTRFGLTAYIAFAYKLTTSQARELASQLPRWAATARFDIQARANSNPTKDQMRLMMQSLLADRFKLAVHMETRQLPVFGLVLAKAGKTGPQLRSRSADSPCHGETPPGSTPPSSTSSTTVSWITAPCGAFIGQVVSGRIQVSARDVSMAYIANLLVAIGQLDRPVIDRTGLTGNFDLTMDAPGVPRHLAQPLSMTPSRQHFCKFCRITGLKLESKTGPIGVLVIDHLEEPSEY